MRTSCLAVVFSTVLGWCFASPVLAGSAAAAPPAPWVTGGQEAKACAWPSVPALGVKLKGQASSGACTGTLVHPRVVIFAAHCQVVEKVMFGPDPRASNTTTYTEVVKQGTNPRYLGAGSIAQDFGYAVLKEPVKGFPITPIAQGCELAALQKQGTKVNFVGFSRNNQSSNPPLQRWANSTVTRVGGGVIDSGGQGVTGCPGDSGGPLMAQLPDGSWRTIGITSEIYPDHNACGKANGYNRFSQIRQALIDWVEKESGVDITPCFDNQGQPTPSEACDAFMAYAGDPSAPKGTQANACQEASTIWAGGFCEVPKHGPDEDEPGDPKDPEGETGTTGEEDSDGESDSGEQTEGESESGQDSPQDEETDSSGEDQTDTSGDPKEPSGESGDSKGSGSGSGSGTDPDASGTPKSPEPDAKSEDTVQPGESQEPSTPKGSAMPGQGDDGADSGGCRVELSRSPALASFALLALLGFRRRRRS